MSTRNTRASAAAMGESVDHTQEPVATRSRTSAAAAEAMPPPAKRKKTAASSSPAPQASTTKNQKAASASPVAKAKPAPKVKHAPKASATKGQKNVSGALNTMATPAKNLAFSLPNQVAVPSSLRYVQNAQSAFPAPELSGPQYSNTSSSLHSKSAASTSPFRRSFDPYSASSVLSLLEQAPQLGNDKNKSKEQLARETKSKAVSIDPFSRIEELSAPNLSKAAAARQRQLQGEPNSATARRPPTNGKAWDYLVIDTSSVQTQVNKQCSGSAVDLIAQVQIDRQAARRRKEGEAVQQNLLLNQTSSAPTTTGRPVQQPKEAQQAPRTFRSFTPEQISQWNDNGPPQSNPGLQSLMCCNHGLLLTESCSRTFNQEATQGQLAMFNMFTKNRHKFPADEIAMGREDPRYLDFELYVAIYESSLEYPELNIYGITDKNLLAYGVTDNKDLKFVKITSTAGHYAPLILTRADCRKTPDERFARLDYGLDYKCSIHGGREFNAYFIEYIPKGFKYKGHSHPEELDNHPAIDWSFFKPLWQQEFGDESTMIAAPAANGRGLSDGQPMVDFRAMMDGLQMPANPFMMETAQSQAAGQQFPLETIGRLTHFGFSQREVVNVLEACGGNLDRAADLLLAPSQAASQEVPPEKIAQLVALGFCQSEARDALVACAGNVEHAAGFLFQGQPDVDGPAMEEDQFFLPEDDLMPDVDDDDAGYMMSGAL